MGAFFHRSKTYAVNFSLYFKKLKCVLLHNISNLGTTGHACWCIDFHPGEPKAAL